MTRLSEGELLAVGAAMSAAGTSPTGSLTATLIAGGRSNLTYRLTDGRSAWVLRTPPRDGRTASAHDVAREHRVTEALARTGAVPVARPVVLVEDDRVLGVPFTVCDFVEGTALRTRSDLASYDDAGLAALCDGLVGTLAALHGIDHRAAGLEGFGRPDGYAERQLRRWSGQWETVGTPGHATAASAVLAGLARALPEQRAVAVVHGDYRVDNTLVRGVDVAAVVDWELSTIGDPVADLAMMCTYRHPELDLVLGAPSAWTSDRLPSIDQLAAGYESAGGAQLADWSAHLALASFKVAVIAAGIEHRRRAGSGSGPGYDTAAEAVGPYLERAHAALYA